MTLLIAAFIGALAIGFYFLRLMGDGRRLEERQRLPGLTASPDAPLWTARFFSEVEAGDPSEGPCLGRDESGLSSRA